MKVPVNESGRLYIITFYYTRFPGDYTKKISDRKKRGPVVCIYIKEITMCSVL